jgi:hypothetical protein
MIPRPVLVAWPQPCHTSFEAVTVPSPQARSKDFGWTTVWLKQLVRPAVLAPAVADEGPEELATPDGGLDDEPQAAIGRATAISMATDMVASIGLLIPRGVDIERLLS